MVNLGRSISEYEEHEISFIFEHPQNYDEIVKDDRWILVGRKGSGKSSYIDFRVSEENGEIRDVIRPNDRLNKEVLSVHSSILAKFSGKAEDSVIEDEVKENLTVVLDFLINTAVMRKLIEGKSETYLNGSIASVYNFLVQNNLHEGSIVRKSIRLIHKLISQQRAVGNLVEALEESSETSYEDAVDGLHNYLCSEKIKFVLYVDGIDDFGFDYSIRNRALYNAMLATVMRINENSVLEKTPLRVLLAIPSELFETSVLWNRDKVYKKTAYLHWEDTTKVQNLVNKRIAVEIGRRKKQPRWKGDKYSISSEHTWDRFFPKIVYNKLGKKEELFEYILRHSLYTPRTVLDICTAILELADSKGIDISEIESMTGSKDYSLIAAEAIEQRSIHISRSVQDIFEKIYSGYAALLHIFNGASSGFRKNTLYEFIQDECCGVLTNNATKIPVIEPAEVLKILFRSGFIGLGRNTHDAPQNCEQYQLEFSYLRPVIMSDRWDIALISPIFYDFVGIKRDPITNVIPHKKLLIPPKSIKALDDLVAAH